MAETIEQQLKTDEEVLKNVGDSRTVIQEGSIKLSDGRVIPTEIQAIRTRNENGGTDVTIKVHKI